MKLVYESSGEPVKVGDKVTYQDRVYRVAEMREDSNTIVLTYPSATSNLTFDFNPIVFNMVWV